MVRRWRAGWLAARAAQGVTAPRHAVRAAERREWAQRCGAILTCVGRAAAGVDAETCPKDAEQEEWRDACLHSECSQPEGLRLAQAGSEGHWRAGTGRALRRAWGGGRRETRPRGLQRAWR